MSASAYRGVRLIKVSFKVNKGNTFGDFGYCPLNRGCPLNTGFTVVKYKFTSKAGGFESYDSHQLLCGGMVEVNSEPFRIA